MFGEQKKEEPTRLSTGVSQGRTMRSTRPANNGVGLQQNVARGQIRFFHSLQHGYHGHRADIGAILVLCGQRHRQKAGVLHVIDAYDAHLVGHTYAITH